LGPRTQNGSDVWWLEPVLSGGGGPRGRVAVAVAAAAVVTDADPAMRELSARSLIAESLGRETFQRPDDVAGALSMVGVGEVQDEIVRAAGRGSHSCPGSCRSRVLFSANWVGPLRKRRAEAATHLPVVEALLWPPLAILELRPPHIARSASPDHYQPSRAQHA